MWESAAPLLVAEDQRRVLEGWRRAPSTPQGVALRASVILMAADGVPNRTIAKTLGVSPDTVNRIWRAHELQPHRVTSFKLSNDPRFVEKLTDVVGLYLNPPEHAIVLCVDEKSQIQAVDRTQPGLPLKKGRAGTMTHDYKRNGTTTL